MWDIKSWCDHKVGWWGSREPSELRLVFGGGEAGGEVVGAFGGAVTAAEGGNVVVVVQLHAWGCSVQACHVSAWDGTTPLFCSWLCPFSTWRTTCVPCSIPSLPPPSVVLVFFENQNLYATGEGVRTYLKESMQVQHGSIIIVIAIKHNYKIIDIYNNFKIYI